MCVAVARSPCTVVDWCSQVVGVVVVVVAANSVEGKRGGEEMGSEPERAHAAGAKHAGHVRGTSSGPCQRDTHCGQDVGQFVAALLPRAVQRYAAVILFPCVCTRLQNSDNLSTLDRTRGTR
jgi:hypothetical protein